MFGGFIRQHKERYKMIKSIKSIIGILCRTFLTGTAVSMFLLPDKIVSGGVSGASTGGTDIVGITVQYFFPPAFQLVVFCF